MKFLYQAGMILDLTVGPEIGWLSRSGFDYGASARVGITPFIYGEVGHFFNSKKTYFNISGNIPFLILLGMFLSK